MEKEITLEQLMKELGCTRQTIYNYMKAGMPRRKEFNGIRYKNMFMFSEVQRWLSQQQAKRD